MFCLKLDTQLQWAVHVYNECRKGYEAKFCNCLMEQGIHGYTDNSEVTHYVTAFCENAVLTSPLQNPFSTPWESEAKQSKMKGSA